MNYNKQKCKNVSVHTVVTADIQLHSFLTSPLDGSK